MVYVVALGITLALVLMWLAIYLASREKAKRKRAEEKIIRLNQELEQRIFNRTIHLEATIRQLGEEITKRKQAEEGIRKLNAELEQKVTRSTAQLEAIKNYAKNIISTVRVPLVVLDAELRVISANQSFYQTFQVTPEETEKRLLYDLDKRQWDIPLLKELLEGILFKDTQFNDFEVEHDFPTIGHKVMLLNARSILNKENQTQVILLAIEDITERTQAEEKIKRLNEDLKRHAMDLEAANKELGSFSYSVSHDLRAPLRAVDGFSRVLLEDYTDKLDDEGRRLLNIIRSNAQKMEELIEDLLTLSRIGRKEIGLLDIDMDKLAKAVFDEIKAATPERKLQFNIEPLPPAHGDPLLIRQVFVNLLSNAIKFTRQRDTGVIEVDGRGSEGENVYYVKDNGIGFDMQYSDKLFGVFQRLHSGEEFEGTGVGLAIVQRIIHRHGGRIWAEGKVNEGATFYFTLPLKPLKEADKNGLK